MPPKTIATPEEVAKSLKSNVNNSTRHNRPRGFASIFKDRADKPNNDLSKCGRTGILRRGR